MVDGPEVPLDSSLADALRRLSKLYIPTRYADALPSGDPADKFTAADAELVVAEVDGVWRQLAEAQEAGG